MIFKPKNDTKVVVFVCLRVHVCMHMCSLAYACICGSHRSTSSIYLYYFHINFWDKVIHWTSNIPFLLYCLASEPLVSSFLSFRSPLNPSSVLSDDSKDILVWLCFMWVLEIQKSGLLISQQAVYILRHILNSKSMRTLIWLSSLRTFYYAKLLCTGCSNASFSPYNCLAFCLKMTEPHWMRKT